MSAQALKLQTNSSIMKAASMPQLALLILQSFGMIQIPIEDKYWSGAIYYAELPAMEFTSKILYCMSAFQAPYKAVLIMLYEDAERRENEKLKGRIKESLDFKMEDMPKRFRKLGLDDSLVLPSFVINTSYLQEQIRKERGRFGTKISRG